MKVSVTPVYKTIFLIFIFILIYSYLYINTCVQGYDDLQAFFVSLKYLNEQKILYYRVHSQPLLRLLLPCIVGVTLPKPKPVGHREFLLKMRYS